MAQRRNTRSPRGRAVRAADDETPAQGSAPAEDRSQAMSPAGVEDSHEPDDWFADEDGDGPDDDGGAFPGSLPSLGESRGQQSLAMQRWGEGDLVDQSGVKWQEPALLDAPPARPGMRQRWVRVESREGPDSANLSRALQQGYRPRDPGTVPGGFSAPTINHGTFGQCIKVEGMVLMEMPEHVAAERDYRYSQEIDRLETAIKSDLEGVRVEGGPAIVRKTKTEVSRGTGRRPRVME